MSKMYIDFNHNGENIYAELVYNFKEYEDIMLVVPQLNNKGLSEIILLTRENNKWNTSSSLQYQFPYTVQSILECVNEKFD